MSSLTGSFAAALLVAVTAMTSSIDGAMLSSNIADVVQGETGCFGAGPLCCPGRNMSCAAVGRRSSSKDPDSTCYCDEACLEVGDCCLDYRSTCRGMARTIIT